MSTKLRILSKSQPLNIDNTLGYVKFNAAIPSILKIGLLFKDGKPGKPWKLIGQFSTGDFNRLHGIALDQDDSIVVCSWVKGLKVFKRNGDVKSTMYDSPGTISVGVLPGKKYVSSPHGTRQIKICDSRGKQTNTYPITSVQNVQFDANSLTVDCDNRIIVGQVANTISIHNTDGSLVSKFATPSMPYRIAATSNRKIVSSFHDAKKSTSVQLMDYSGGNIRVMEPPGAGEVKVWSPEFVSCGKGEIFVSNEGDPMGVYRYTSEGDYLSCVTTQVSNPSGTALSRDGMELFVADHGDSHIKIFQRP